MSDPERIERLMSKLKAFWYSHPEKSFCDVVAVIGSGKGSSDVDFEKSLDKAVEKFRCEKVVEASK